MHVVTVNDYLARRDAMWMKPIYDLLGVTVGVLQNMQPYEEKRDAYAADVTYGTNSEFGFDYLRDNMATTLEEKVQHGGRPKPEEGKSHYHTFAIVDEVDNILIDEARTPLIISGAPEQAADLYAKFARLAPQMKPGKTPEGMDPRMKKEFVADFDYEFDEKHKTVAVTEQGVAKAERFLGIDHLYRAENGHLVNHLIQSLKAESLYKRDVDYAVIDGEVKIIDEFTGRILEGRRWSEGLHQAVEAKEGVRVQEENQTLATITLQNYFRMYDKLAGMTGTALTEATEFMKIYELPVVQIPTNQPMVRNDRNDQVYKTKDGKWSAVVREIEERHKAGQPVLVGTISVEVSELLSNVLTKQGHPAHGAQRQARARRARGRDRSPRRARRARSRSPPTWPAAASTSSSAATPSIWPGSRSPSSGCSPAIPTTTSTTRRCCPRSSAASRACASRCSRPAACSSSAPSATSRGGSTTSCAAAPAARATPASRASSCRAQDDLVRLFAGERIYKILDRLGSTDDEGNEEPIEAGMLSKQIEKAQTQGRGAALPDAQAHARVRRRAQPAARGDLHLSRRGARGPRHERRRARGDREPDRAPRRRSTPPATSSRTGTSTGCCAGSRRSSSRAPTIGEHRSRPRRSRGADPAPPGRGARAVRPREEQLGEELMRALERFLLLQIIDQRWREHLYDMDYLREGIHLRGFAQIEPLVAYKNEAFELFRDLMNSVWGDFARMIFHVEVTVEGEDGGAPPPPSRRPSSRSSSDRRQPQRHLLGRRRASRARWRWPPRRGGAGARATPRRSRRPPVEQRRVDETEQIGRNDPCWCGSGKKFKKCHGA